MTRSIAARTEIVCILGDSNGKECGRHFPEIYDIRNLCASGAVAEDLKKQVTKVSPNDCNNFVLIFGSNETRASPLKGLFETLFSLALYNNRIVVVTPAINESYSPTKNSEVDLRADMCDVIKKIDEIVDNVNNKLQCGRICVLKPTIVANSNAKDSDPNVAKKWFRDNRDNKHYNKKFFQDLLVPKILQMLQINGLSDNVDRLLALLHEGRLIRKDGVATSSRRLKEAAGIVIKLQSDLNVVTTFAGLGCAVKNRKDGWQYPGYELVSSPDSMDPSLLSNTEVIEKANVYMREAKKRGLEL